MRQSSISYQVIRRFTLSKGFESPFGLQLLADMLNVIVQRHKSVRMDFESTMEIKNQEESLDESFDKRISEFDQNSKVTPLSSESKLRQSCNTDGDDGDDDYNDPAARKRLFDSTNVSESTALNTDISKTPNNEITKTSDLDANKNDFFSSDSDCSSSSSVCEKEFVKKRKRKKKDEVLEEERNNQREKRTREKPNDEMDSEKELEKLLSMTEFNSNTRACTSVSEEKKKEKKKRKSKKEELSLLDCLESENCGDVGNSDLEKGEMVKEEERGSSFLSFVNSEIKKSFLLSSGESNKSSEEADDGIGKETPKQPKKKKKKKKKHMSVKKERRDELNEYRIPNFSPKEKDTPEKEISEKELIEKDCTSKEGNEDESDDSVKCVQHVKKRKRHNSEKNTDTDSDSDIQQVQCKTESPSTKGRRNIKKILKKESLKIETKQALKMETDRKKRVSERQKLFQKFFPHSDTDSKLILDFDPQTKEELVVVDESLSKMLKPHQKEGIRFMWNCCFESLKRLEEDSGSGCVLAHCMGLGKTLQVITLVHTILTHNTGVHTVMIICPLNTIRNWTNEFREWQEGCCRKIEPMDLIPFKSKGSRLVKVKSWMKDGGVLVISYEMLRSLIKTNSRDSVFFKGLLNPGPDVVVCDEGHVLKNNTSGISKCISEMKTLRRIILTGTPLQNNLVEYYCMVQFVKPNILGTMKEFKNRFVNPINNGQFEDSTALDVCLMKRRSHVLHTMLDGFVQRFGYYVLTPFLPEKQEYVISIALTETQENIYRVSIERCNREGGGLLKDFHWLQKIWTHPRVLMMHSLKLNVEENTSNEWSRYVRNEEYDDIRSSGKLLLLFKILKRSKEIGDKVLVFSQSLYSLNLIEFFLRAANRDYFNGVRSKFAESWVFGTDYVRLDGSTSSEKRDSFCKEFNNVHNTRFRLFLISTKAGGLGINLVGANRVVVFDASWNPTHDVQSIFRVYRFGQEKPCFIYRFLAAATMEEKIYKRQVTKLSLAHRILDEHQIERHYTMGNLQELYRYDPLPKTEWKVPKIPKDKLFGEILALNRDIIVGYHEHDSLLENKEEEELTEEERRAAWEDYEKEKLTPELPPIAVNGIHVPMPAMDRVNHEGLKMLQRYKQGMVGPSVTHVANNVQNINQLCKIVDVRTLRKDENTQRTDTEKQLKTGQSLAMRPFRNEHQDRPLQRSRDTFNMIFPWGPPSKSST